MGNLRSLRQLAPIAEVAKSSSKDLEITPNMDDRNGARVEDAPLTATDVAKDPHIDKRYVNQTPEEIAAYKKDTDATRYTFGIWDFVNKNWRITRLLCDLVCQSYRYRSEYPCGK